MFRDRTDAGEQLVDLLLEEGVEADIVLAVPRGGLPVARPVADALEVPLDVVVARKMGAPNNPELAIGAAAADGTAWFNEDLIQRLGLDEAYVSAEREKQAEAAHEKRERYRRGATPDVAGRDVLIVDDGAATGATTVACARQVRENGARRIVLALPVASEGALEELRDEVDAIYTVSVPRSFGAVGQYYERFEQVTDDEAMEYLA